MVVGYIMILILGLLSTKFASLILKVPQEVIWVIVVGFCILGSYAVNNSMFDVYVMFAAGFVGFLCKRCEVPLGPFVLALLLGNLCESNFRRALSMSLGDYSIFLTRPITVVLLIPPSASSARRAKRPSDLHPPEQHLEKKGRCIMAFSIQPGVWPVMITPFTEDNKPDFKAIEGLCNWYIKKGCTGIFAVCQSSEMAFLTEQEKLDIAKAVVDAVDGRIQVVASGHTADSKSDQYKQIEDMMKIPGIGAYVLVSNRLDQNNEGEEVFFQNAQEIFDRFPEVDFGIYECPMPWKRLVSLDFLRKVAPEGRMVFLKDTCCDYELIRERLKAVEGTPLKIFNANAQSWYDSYCHGSAGYNGVMANFHPDLYKWAYDHKDSDPEKAQLVAHFLTTAAMIEMRAYPVSAKYHQNLVDVPMSLVTRSADAAKLDKNARGEVESLIAMENYVRKQLGIL